MLFILSLRYVCTSTLVRAAIIHRLGGGGWCKSKYTMVILFQFTPHPGSEIDFLIRPPNGRCQVANLGGQKFGNCEEQENVM